MLTLSKSPKVEKTKKFRVKSLLSNQECSVEVSDIDDVLLGVVRTATADTPEDRNNDNGDTLGTSEDRDEGSRRPDSMRSENSIFSEDEVMRINNDREKTIFLRAALQLLDEENNAASAKYKISPLDDNHEKLRAIYNTADFFRTKGKTEQTSGNCGNRTIREDNIRFGWLKKASKGGTFASVSSVWKTKFVELRHGYFCYEDDVSGTKKVPTKNIPLSMDVCYCQVMKMREKDGDCVFELSMRGGSRRLWQAGSVRDRDAWILSINSAMSKSPQRFLEPSKECLLNAPRNSMRSLLEQSVSTGESDTHCTFSSLTSRVGAAAPYADEISRYCAIMHVIKSVEGVGSYRHIIDQLRGIKFRITVPVFFVKNHSTSKCFGATTTKIEDVPKDFEMNITPRRSITERRNQAWKDMQRDALLIDGEIISGGDRGAEGVLGALVRHLLDKAELLKAYAASPDYQCRQAVAAGEAQAMSSARNRNRNRYDRHDAAMADRSRSPGGRSYNTQGNGNNKDRPKSLNCNSPNYTDSNSLKRSESMGNFSHKVIEKVNNIVELGSKIPGNSRQNYSDGNENNYVGSSKEGREGREFDDRRGKEVERGSGGGGSTRSRKYSRELGSGDESVNTRISLQQPSVLRTSLSVHVTSSDVSQWASAEGREEEGGTGTALGSDSSKATSGFRLSESLALVHAREILALSNRTQSGGDTYFCIDTLLRDKDQDFSILTPLGVEADPLELTIDVIDVKFHPPPTSPKRKHPESGTHKNSRTHSSYTDISGREDGTGKGPGQSQLTGVNRDGSRVKLNVVSESRRSGIKSAARRRFFGNPQEDKERGKETEKECREKDGHKSTSKVLRSLFFHNSNQVNETDGWHVPPDPHVSLTSLTSTTTNESSPTTMRKQNVDLGLNSTPRLHVLTEDVQTPVRTSLGSGLEDNMGRVMRGCSDADLLAYDNWDDLSSDEMEEDNIDSDGSVEIYMGDEIEGSLEDLIRTSCYGDVSLDKEESEGAEFEKHLGFCKSENRVSRFLRGHSNPASVLSSCRNSFKSETDNTKNNNSNNNNDNNNNNNNKKDVSRFENLDSKNENKDVRTNNHHDVRSDNSEILSALRNVRSTSVQMPVPSSSSSAHTSTTTSTSTSGIPRQPIIPYSPQIRLNVENGNVDFTSPTHSPQSPYCSEHEDLQNLVHHSPNSSSVRQSRMAVYNPTTSSPSSPTFSTTSPFADISPSMDNLSMKTHYSRCDSDDVRRDGSGSEKEKKKEKGSGKGKDREKEKGEIRSDNRDSERDVLKMKERIKERIRQAQEEQDEIEREKEREKERELERFRNGLQKTGGEKSAKVRERGARSEGGREGREREKDGEKEEEEENENGSRNSTPLSKGDIKPPRSVRTAAPPVAVKGQGKSMTYPPPRNLDTIAELDVSSPQMRYEYLQKLNSAPASPDKKSRPTKIGTAGSGIIAPRASALDQWNPMQMGQIVGKGGGVVGGGGMGSQNGLNTIKEREEMSRDKAKKERTLISGIIEAQAQSQSLSHSLNLSGGGSKESNTHQKIFRGSDRNSGNKREDINGSVSSGNNNNFRGGDGDITYVCDSVQPDDDYPMSPTWGRSRSQSTGTGNTSHVNDSSTISTGSSGFFSRLLNTPSKHLKKKYEEERTGGGGVYRRKDDGERDRDRDRDEESVCSRGGGSGSVDPRSADYPEETEYIKSQLCLRVQVRSSSRYRLCDSNPQDEGDSNWATAVGVFCQTFILRGDSCCLEDRLVASDRLVTIIMDHNISNYNSGDGKNDNNSNDIHNSTDVEISEKDGQQTIESVKREIKVY